ncbi:hypothetical protein [Saccharothrix sp. Mg75]|uniref:hypothetical protein n=1 Tax=Saccharothrix sp. Mg75 TaxID=3445357 RepID=UPI003EEDB6C4
MRRFRLLTGALAAALALVLAPTAGATAAPAPSSGVPAPAPGAPASASAAMDGPLFWATTLTTTWVRQCATLSCGYHSIPAGQQVGVHCSTSN